MYLEILPFGTLDFLNMINDRICLASNTTPKYWTLTVASQTIGVGIWDRALLLGAKFYSSTVSMQSQNALQHPQ